MDMNNACRVWRNLLVEQGAGCRRVAAEPTGSSQLGTLQDLGWWSRGRAGGGGIGGQQRQHLGVAVGGPGPPGVRLPPM